MGKVVNMFKSDDANQPRDSRLIEMLIEKAAQKEDKLFEKAVRANAKPPIVGKITPNKLKKAGIMRCFNNETMESWLEQRGERISEKFRIVWE